ncbi:MAG: acyltransferase [Armatimonadota bacterium]
MGFNRHVPWPVSPCIMVAYPRNIEFHPDDINNFQTIGCYFRASEAKIKIGRGSYIAPGVGIITANHDIDRLECSAPGQEVVIGERCWIGMNSIILPGVTLGPHTIVGAGAVVTGSFPEGHCVIAGVPAKQVK